MPDLIRRANARDTDTIARIYIEASLAALGDIANVEALESAARGRHAMWAPLTRSEPGYAMHVWDDRGVCGFVSVGPASEPGAGHLFALYVEPRRWAAGIGSRLLDRGLEHLRTNRVATAELWV